MSAPDKFRDRLVRLTLTRLAGAVTAGIGMMLIAVEHWPLAVHVAGGVLVAAGLAWLLLAPRALRRQWRRDDA